MDFTSYNDRSRVRDTFEQINTAINQQKEWNAEVTSAEEYYLSSGGK